MADILIRKELWYGPNKRERKHWSIQETLLLGARVWVGSKTLNSLLTSWWLVSPNLNFEVQLDFLPLILSIP